MWRLNAGLLPRLPIDWHALPFCCSAVVAVAHAVGNNSNAQPTLGSTTLWSHDVQLSKDVKLKWSVKNMSAGAASQRTVEFRLTVANVDTPENYYYALGVAHTDAINKMIGLANSLRCHRDNS